MGALLALGGCGQGEAEKAVSGAIADPAARFQSVRNRTGFVCGEVNGRGGPGYVRLVYDEETGAAFVDPGEASAQLSASRADAACGKPFAYQSVEERLGCAAAPRQESEIRSKRSFETLWRKACG